METEQKQKKCDFCDCEIGHNSACPQILNNENIWRSGYYAAINEMELESNNPTYCLGHRIGMMEVFNKRIKEISISGSWIEGM